VTKYFYTANEINPYLFFPPVSNFTALQRGTNSKNTSISYSLSYSRISRKEFNFQGLLQALTIDTSSAIVVKGLTIKNSQQMHFVIARSDSVRVSRVLVSAPGDSPNTDGIHITESTNVVLQDCKIGTGSQTLFPFLLFVSRPASVKIFVLCSQSKCRNNQLKM
jgi:hypothetical protein